MSKTLTLTELNRLPAADARLAFAQCCVAARWMDAMVASRPFASVERLHQVAADHWQGLEEADYLQAFEGHPKIGDVSSLKQKYASTKTLAAGEQSRVDEADDSVINALASGNQAYEDRYGFIFIVCASGKSAAEMLALLQARLHNDRGTEIQNAADEQAKITRLRINKLLGLTD
ncbi:2-oxo-4-hydroxy-4-carboxy-5-ureidoimidazoline decarboxylase [Oceanobacter sp. 4_MG-2023]|uniref:2-oxo-4-hydroxy-4-carboxy-5-ureidoimidazoline decarboxylase n=1 Tax=Oceanobacter sp. 4_MG-2023 TaxID=3062623 RepID=UPI002735885D|nr:2-oxo-4-hydroxy-4-carboxy-5-ureidoimidazoline decarboxylase [Oceanobacter sp. 4_MG-2023]MDP2548375.1 2-oxo-4-hydroxy-4-carboxy-5-ureidoimidazoline decarboxylase [Oceanobacter sp. 4_MG-2023]